MKEGPDLAKKLWIEAVQEKLQTEQKNPSWDEMKQLVVTKELIKIFKMLLK